MSTRRLATRLKALGEPSRLRILRLLPALERGDGGAINGRNCRRLYNVSELAAELQLSQPMISHHLGVLRQAGLVRNRKMCRDVYYWIDKKALGELRAALGELTAR